MAGQLKKMLAERMLTAELSHHLASEDQAGKNHRNGSSPKKVLTPGGELQLDVPRDRLSSFELKQVGCVRLCGGKITKCVRFRCKSTTFTLTADYLMQCDFRYANTAGSMTTSADTSSILRQLIVNGCPLGSILIGP